MPRISHINELIIKRVRTCPLILLLVLCSVAAWADTVRYTDKLGRTVTIGVPVRRAVLFETYELTAALGAWDKVAGISHYAYENDLMRAVKPGLARTVPSPGSSNNVNIETLLRLRPDLVITWSFKPEMVRFMESKGLTVVALYPESLAELYDAMRFQGRIFGKERKVEQTIAKMEKIFALIRQRSAKIPKERQKRIVWLGSKPTIVSGNVGLNHELTGLIHGVNPAAAIRERSTDVSLERIIAWRPEVIFIWGTAGYGSADLLRNPQWRHTDAVRTGMVHKAPKWSAWSPRIAVVALWMAMRAYPDYYRDIAFEKIADDFHRSVYGISYRKAGRIEG